MYALQLDRTAQNKKFGARSPTARLKTKNLALAVGLQGSKQKIWCSQLDCTAQNRKFDARSWTARLKTKNLVLAVGLHGSKQKIWRSQFNCKHSKKENNEKQDACSEKD